MGSGCPYCAGHLYWFCSNMRWRNSKPKVEEIGDPFDRLYKTWAEQAFHERLEPPSRAMWDRIILLLISSNDPERIRRYRRIDAEGPDSLGSDANEIWRKVPGYTSHRSIPLTNRADLDSHIKANEGSMRQVMDKAGQSERYHLILEQAAARKVQVKRGQAQVITMGCIGLSLIAFMALTVLLIIGLRLAG